MTPKAEAILCASRRSCRRADVAGRLQAPVSPSGSTSRCCDDRLASPHSVMPHPERRWSSLESPACSTLAGFTSRCLVSGSTSRCGETAMPPSAPALGAARSRCDYQRADVVTTAFGWQRRCLVAAADEQVLRPLVVRVSPRLTASRSCDTRTRASSSPWTSRRLYRRAGLATSSRTPPILGSRLDDRRAGVATSRPAGICAQDASASRCGCQRADVATWSSAASPISSCLAIGELGSKQEPSPSPVSS